MFQTSSIPHNAHRISQGIRRLPKLMRTQVCLLCMHKSGKVVSYRPPAPSSPNKQLMFSTEVDSYMRTVAEAAINLWQPGPVQMAPLKRLQPGAKKGKAQARDTPSSTVCEADIAANVVVALADMVAQAVADVGLPSSILAFITTNGNGWPPFQIIFFPLLVKI